MNERAKKANLHNKKLHDCRYHLNDDPPAKGREMNLWLNKPKTTIFITEGDSASGLLPKQEMETQVFSLRVNIELFWTDKNPIVYENEEFNLKHTLILKMD